MAEARCQPKPACDQKPLTVLLQFPLTNGRQHGGHLCRVHEPSLQQIIQNHFLVIRVLKFNVIILTSWISKLCALLFRKKKNQNVVHALILIPLELLAPLNVFCKAFYICYFICQVSNLSQATNEIPLPYPQHTPFFLSKTIPKYGFSKLDIQKPLVLSCQELICFKESSKI